MITQVLFVYPVNRWKKLETETAPGCALSLGSTLLGEFHI